MADYQTRRTYMVDTQVRPSDVTKFPIIEAMLEIPREVYLPDEKREAAYVGQHVALDGGRVVLDARTFSKMLDFLDVQPDEVVLDLGCALGYSTAVLAHLAEFVVAVEDDADRVEEAQATLSEQGIDNAAVVHGPLAEGAPKSGPYDVIMLEGAAETIPDALIDQLKDDGRIAAIFTEGTLGVVRIGYKVDGAMTWRFAFNASAPLLDGFARTTAFAL